MEYYKDIYSIGKTIYENPELGYKEVNTSNLVKDFLLNYVSEDSIEKFSITGLKVQLPDKEKGFKLGIIAELDAVYAPNHFHCNPETGAAHNCGHHSQVAISLSVLKGLMESQSYKDYDFNIVFIFVPAEEYLDIEYREKLMKDGVISYMGGKPQAMKEGVFDDIDFCIATHAMGGEFEKRTIELHSDLAGFAYKKYKFLGRPAHAGFAPHDGINAYSMSTVFNVAVGLMRQQIDEREMVRINPVVFNGDMGINIIPEEMTMGCDVRTHGVEYMIEILKRLDNAAKGAALSLSGKVEIETIQGYLPFKQDRYLSTFALEAYKEDDQVEDMRIDNPISAAGDIGDLAVMMPCIQLGYSGFRGTIHGNDFIDDDPEFIYGIFPNYLLKVIDKMAGNIDKSKIYRKSFSEYEEIIKRILGEVE